MSALQLQETGHRFVQAMGPMIDDENMMSAVFAYIAALRSNHAPCQYSAQQVREFAAKAEFATDGYTDLLTLPYKENASGLNKFIQNGQLYILRDGVMYNVVGGKVAEM